MAKPTQEARFEYKGYTCVVLFQWLGFRCGYVGLPKGHKFYEVDYMEMDIDCHYGLTYSEKYLYGQEDENTWWVGFDCGHSGDGYDFEAIRKYYSDNESVMRITEENEKSYYYKQYGARTLDYAINECKKIVDQLDNPELLGGGE